MDYISIEVSLNLFKFNPVTILHATLNSVFAFYVSFVMLTY